MTVVAEAITRVHREEWTRVIAVLARRFGDLDSAEVGGCPESGGPCIAFMAFSGMLEAWARVGC